MANWFANWGRFVVRYAWPVGLFCVAVAGLSAFAAQKIGVNFSSKLFYGGNDALVQDLEDFQSRWGVDDDVILVLASAKRGTLFNTDALRELVDTAETIQQKYPAFTVTTLPKIPFEVENETTNLLQLWQHKKSWRPTIRKMLLSESRLSPAFISLDGKHSAIVVQTGISSDDPVRAAPVVAGLKQIIREDRSIALRWELAGIAALRAAMFEKIIEDQRKFSPLTFSMIAVVLLLLFRSAVGVFAPLVVTFFSLLVLLGIMGTFAQPISLLNQAYFTLIPVMAVSDCMHMVVRYQAERRVGLNKKEAIVETLRHVGVACFYTSVTTAVGFASLSLASMPILRSFGGYAAWGIVVAFMATMTLTPLLCLTLDWSRSIKPAAFDLTSNALAGLAGFVDRRWLWILGGTFVLINLSAYNATLVTGDSFLTKLLADEQPVSKANKVFDANLAGLLAAEYELSWKTALQPQDTEAVLDDFGSWVGRKHDARLVELRTKPEHPNRIRLTLHARDYGALDFIALAEQAKAWLDKELDPAIAVSLTGTSYVAYKGVQGIARELSTSLMVAFGVMSLLFLLMYRNVLVTLVAVVANGLPLLLALGMLGYLGKELDPLAGVILVVALGIAVDDTIHMLSRFYEHRKQGEEAMVAMRHAVERTGSAIVWTSVVLIAGIGVNAWSSFPVLQLLGTLGTFVIFAALVCDLLLLPALLRVFARWL